MGLRFIEEIGCEKWIDENGESVLEFPFFTKAYLDKESKELESKYDSSEKNRTISMFGSSETHHFADKIANLYPAIQGFVGFIREELNSFSRLDAGYDEADNLLGIHHFFRLKKID